MGVREPFSSLTHYVGHPVINFAIMMLIVVGGLGFHMGGYMGQPAVLEKIQDAEQGDSHHNGSFDPDPGSDFYFLEFNGPEWRGRGARIWASLFQSVTPRTAGI